MARNHAAIKPTSKPTTSRSEIERELERRIDHLTEALMEQRNIKCDRCGKAHSSIVRAVRYHMARWWKTKPGPDRDAEWEFIDALRPAIPPGIDVTVHFYESDDILKEKDG